MDRIGGYVLRELVGLGASGSVWSAERVGRPGVACAVKRIHLGAGAAAADRLRSEASTLAALDHPHIVRVLDVVEAGEELAIVMPLARGGSLLDLLAERRLSPGEVVALLAPVADALASAHRAGIGHGDVKPANILLTADGEPLLADFGAARTLDGGDEPDRPADVRALAAVVGAATGRVHHGLVVLADAVVEGRAGSAGRITTAEAFADALRRSVPVGEIVLPGPARTGAPIRVGSMTRPYGPRPPRQDPPATAVSRRVPVAAAAVLGIVAIGLALVGRPRPGVDPQVEVAGPSHGPSACPAGPPAPAPSLAVDFAGDGCPVAVVWRAGVIEVRAAGTAAPRRYDFTRFGAGAGALRSGRLLVGDWDCDGAEGVAYLEPDRNVVHYFDRLPAVGRLRADREATLTGTGVAHVVHRGRCDSVELGPTREGGEGAH